jgi:phage tail-like protein
MPTVSSNFRYLNREGKWLDFHRSGLEVTSSGSLQLLSAPRPASPVSRAAAGQSAPDAPSGVAVNRWGRVFASSPDEAGITVSGDCDPAEVPLSCLSEAAGLRGLDHPRGLLLLSSPERLVVADSGNHRLLFCDTLDWNVREVWGPADLAASPQPSDAPNGFNTPWSVAAESNGRTLYVLDAGNRRVMKFARTGDPDPDFMARVQDSGLAPHPGAIAVNGEGPTARIFIADLQTNSIAVFNPAGETERGADGPPLSISWAGMGNVLALATSADALFVGDNLGRRILCFGLSDGFPFRGAAADFQAYVTAMTVTPQGDRLLAATAQAGQVVQLNPHGAWVDRAVLWSDPISVGSTVTWNRLRATVSGPPSTHVAFHYALANTATSPPVDPAAPDPFADPAWRALPVDTTDFLLTGAKASHLFLGALFTSDQTATPRLAQIRVDFDTESFTRYLPAIYRQPGSDFLERFVRLLQGMFEDIETEVDTLDRYFDPLAAPADALPWLATWLAVDLDQGEAESRIRHSIAGAFHRYRWRGTVEGLRLALLEDAGVHAVITEPIAAASFWGFTGGGGSAGAGGALGLSTHLPPAEPGGAVLGSTAELDHAYLITDDRFGEPLFEGSAWQFLIQVYRHEVGTDARLQLVKEIIERERPAHAMYRLELIDPTMQVGAQARVGIDAIISGAAEPAPLGGGVGLHLAGLPPPRIGSSILGSDLKL